MTVTNELIDSLLANYRRPEGLISENGLLKLLTYQETHLQNFAYLGVQLGSMLVCYENNSTARWTRYGG
jgi:hypothetical protein